MHDVQTEEASLLRDREAANREVINLAESDDVILSSPITPGENLPPTGGAVAHGSKRPTNEAWGCLDLTKLPKFQSF
jgi:hypothetical protein